MSTPPISTPVASVSVLVLSRSTSPLASPTESVLPNRFSGIIDRVFESETADEEISPVSCGAKMFTCCTSRYKQATESTQKSKYFFPKDADLIKVIRSSPGLSDTIAGDVDKIVRPILLLDLLYLVELSKGSLTDLNPFNELEWDAFNQHHRADKLSVAGLFYGFWGSIALTAANAIPVLPGISDWAQATPANNLNLQTGLLSLSVITNIINFIATGIFTYISGNTLVAKTSALGDIKERYSNLAIALIKLYQVDKAAAISIAGKLNIDDKIAPFMKAHFSAEKASVVSTLVDGICLPLKSAQEWIKSGIIPIDAPQSICDAIHTCQKETRLMERESALATISA